MRKRISIFILVLMLPLSGSCIKGDYYIKMTPDLVITDCNEKTLTFRADPSFGTVELLPDKTDTDTYEQFMKEDGSRFGRCNIVGDWFHIAEVSIYEVEVHIDENTSDALRRVTFRCNHIGVDTDVVILQHGYHTNE